jgi:hypothetical protein
VGAWAHAQHGDYEASRAALEASLGVARGRNARQDIALGLDALVRIAQHDGTPYDAACAVERDRLFAQLGIVSPPLVPLPGDDLSIPEPRDTALSASVEPA